MEFPRLTCEDADHNRGECQGHDEEEYWDRDAAQYIPYEDVLRHTLSSHMT